MPYFAWKGIDLQARIKKGAAFAADKDELDLILLKKDIALLSCSIKKVFLKKPISLQSKIDYIMQVSLLMKSGMLLPKALKLVAGQTHNPHFALIAYDIAQNVEHGISLPRAFENNTRVFNALMIQMACVGEESGSLCDALGVLSGHLEAVADFKRKLSSALLLPLVTFAFFLIIILIMLIVIVPQFASIFTSMQKELPGTTKGMLWVSNFLRSANLIYFAASLVGVLLLINYYCKTLRGKKVRDAILMAIPFIRPIIICQAMGGFFQALGVLLQGGMPLVKALSIAKESTTNGIIKSSLESVVGEVNAGMNLADALARHEILCPQDIISLLLVGQESGHLQNMVQRIAQIYQSRLIAQLSRINTLFQPFLLIILGLMIMGLILALYTPIMSLSYAV